MAPGSSSSRKRFRRYHSSAVPKRLLGIFYMTSDARASSAQEKHSWSCLCASSLSYIFFCVLVAYFGTLITPLLKIHRKSRSCLSGISDISRYRDLLSICRLPCTWSETTEMFFVGQQSVVSSLTNLLGIYTRRAYVEGAM